MASEAKYVDIDADLLNTNACEIYINLYYSTYQTSKEIVEFAFSHSQKMALSINCQMKNNLTKQLIRDYLYHFNIVTETLLCSSKYPFSQFKDVFKMILLLNKSIKEQNMPFRVQVLDFAKSDVGNHKFFILRDI